MSFIINKIAVTRGAIFDYEEIVCKRTFLRNVHSEEMEALLNREQPEGEIARLSYYDKMADKELLLFLKKGYDFGMMRTWLLEGICGVEDYDPELETSGAIKKWLEVEVE